MVSQTCSSKVCVIVKVCTSRDRVSPPPLLLACVLVEQRPTAPLQSPMRLCEPTNHSLSLHLAKHRLQFCSHICKLCSGPGSFIFCPCHLKSDSAVQQPRASRHTSASALSSFPCSAILSALHVCESTLTITPHVRMRSTCIYIHWRMRELSQIYDPVQ